MKLYRKLIRPMHSYPGPDYSPRVMPIEKEVKWYPEEERECLEKKYASYNEGSFSNLVFEEKYEPYAIEPKFKKLKVPEKCGSRPVWCPIIKVNNELDKMPFGKRAEFEKLITGLSSLFEGEDLWD